MHCDKYSAFNTDFEIFQEIRNRELEERLKREISRFTGSRVDQDNCDTLKINVILEYFLTINLIIVVTSLQAVISLIRHAL